MASCSSDVDSSLLCKLAQPPSESNFSQLVDIAIGNTGLALQTDSVHNIPAHILTGVEAIGTMGVLGHGFKI